jgi:hypothetical protein
MKKPDRISSSFSNRIFYQIMIVILLMTAIVILILLRPILHPNDFLEYWSASRLIIRANNPYDPNLLYEMQKAVGLQGNQPILFYLPPWVFPFIIIFSVTTFPICELLWMLFSIFVLLICIRYIWEMYGGSGKQNWIAWIIGFTFAPTYIAVGITGQISPLMLVGVTGFLYFIRKPRLQWLAGVFATLIIIKPQVTYLFILAILAWGIKLKQRPMLLGFFISLISESLFSYVLNPTIFTHYFDLMITNSPTEWVSPTIGSVLRLAFGTKYTWLQFTPLIPGLLWFCLFNFSVKRINWHVHTPLILIISVVTSVYAWTYDYVLLLIPLLFSIKLLFNSAGKRAKWYLLAYIIVNLIAWTFRAFLPDFWFFWFAPLLLVWYLMIQDSYQKKAGIILPA